MQLPDPSTFLSLVNARLLELISNSPYHAEMDPKNNTIYFGYGSNLWLHQMAARCPNSTYLGVARLPDYRWMINNRGYANVVCSPDSANSSIPLNEVYGLVYSLTPYDERRLDSNEGVPYSYVKAKLAVQFWGSEGEEWVDVTDSENMQTKEVLVYINRELTEDDKPKHEYVYRMNMGIKDAVRLGVPTDYVKKVMRRFIPESEDVRLKEFAEQQALKFEDERQCREENALRWQEANLS